MNNDEKIRLLIQAKDEATKEIARVNKELDAMGKSTVKMKTSVEEARAVLANMRLYDSLGAPAKQSSGGLTDVASSFVNIATSGNILTGVLGAVGVGFIATGAQAMEAATRSALAARMQETAYMNLAKQSGQSGAETIKAIQDASEQTISYYEAVKLASKAAATGIDLDTQKIVKLMELAKSRAALTGGDTAQAFDVLTTSISYQSAMMLKRNLQIKIASDWEEKYAESIGKSKDALNEEERQMAFLEAILAKTAGETGNLSGAAGQMNDILERSDAAGKNLSDTIGNFFVPAVVTAQLVIGGVTEKLNGLIKTSQLGVAKMVGLEAATSTYLSVLKDTGNFDLAAEKANAAWYNMQQGAMRTFGLIIDDVESAGDALDKLGDKVPSAKFKSQMIAALDVAENYRDQLTALEKRHGETIEKIDKDVIDSGLKAAKERTKAAADAAERESDILSRERDSNADSYKSYMDSLKNLDRDKSEKQKDFAKQEQELAEETARSLQDLARDSAQELFDIENDRRKRIEELDVSVGKRLRANITENERAAILEEQLLAKKSIDDEADDRVAASNRNKQQKTEEIAYNKRQKEEEIAYNKKKDQEEHEYRRAQALETYNDSVDKTRRETQQALDENEKQKQKRLASIEETKIAETTAIEARRVAENKAYAESKTAAGETAKKQMEKILEVKSESEKYAEAMKLYAGTAWQPWIDKAEDYGRKVAALPTPGGTGETPDWVARHSGKNMAGGGDFVVPPGYSGDRYPINVSSGERVTVQTPAQQSSGRGKIEVHIHGNDAMTIWRQLKPLMQRDYEIEAMI